MEVTNFEDSLEEAGFSRANLSAITEVDEPSIIDSSFLEEQSNEAKHFLQDDTDKILKLLFSKELDRESEETSDGHTDNIQPSKLPQTPPEILRERIVNLKCQLSNLEQEHEELNEFTKLERQMHHIDCIPKGKVESLEHDFMLVNDKVEHLMEENTYLKNILEQDEDYVEELETKLTELHRCKSLVENFMSQMRKTLLEHLQENHEGSIKSNQSSETTITSDFNEPHPTGVDCFEYNLKDVQYLIEAVLLDRNDLKIKLEALQLNNVKSNRIQKYLNKKVTELENMLSNSERLKIKFQEELAIIKEDRINIANKVSILENNLEDTSENNIENFKNAIENNNSQEGFMLILRKLNDFLDVSNSCKKCHDILILQTKDKAPLLAFVNVINSSNQPMIFQLLEKFQGRLTIYDGENKILHSTIQNFNRCITLIKDENDEHRKKVCTFRNENTENILKLNEFENISKSACNEKVLIAKKSADVDLDRGDITTQALNTCEYKQNEMFNVVTVLENEKCELQLKVEKPKNTVKLDDIQKKITSVINELENVVDSWDSTKKLNSLCESLPVDKLLSCLHLLMDSDTRATLFQFFDKLKMRLNLYDVEKDYLQTTIEKLENRINNFEIESKLLKDKVEALHHEVKVTLIRKITELENMILKKQPQCICNNHIECEEISLKIHTAESEIKFDNSQGANSKSNLQESVEHLSNVINVCDIQEEIKYVFNEIEYAFESLDGNHGFKELFILVLHGSITSFPSLNLIINSEMQNIIFQAVDRFEVRLNSYKNMNKNLCKTVEELNNRIKDFEHAEVRKKVMNQVEYENDFNGQNTMKNMDLQICCTEDCHEELRTLKEIMSSEITGLDGNEDTQTLMSYSSLEIFKKLMQNIMEKQTEISFDLRRQYQADFEKSQELVEKLNNKLKFQESWIEVLESENDKTSKEQLSMKQMVGDFENKLKMVSGELSDRTTEIVTLNRNLQELTVENEILRGEVDALKQLAKTERESAKCFQNKIIELRDELLTKSKVTADLQDILACIVSEKQDTFNGNSLPELCKVTVGENNTVVFEHQSKNVNCVSPNFGSAEGKANNLVEKENTAHLSSSLTKTLEEEKALLKDLLTHDTADIAFSDQLFKCSNSLPILKEILIIVANKLSQTETCQASYLCQLQSNIDDVTKEFENLKLDIINFCIDFLSDSQSHESYMDSQTLESYTDNQTHECYADNETLEGYAENQTCDSYANNFRKKTVFDSSDTVSLKRELELVKVESAHITNMSKKFEETYKAGEVAVYNIKAELQIIKDEISKKNLTIGNLRKTIEIEYKANEKSKVELQILSENCSNLTIKNSLLEEKVKSLESRLLQIMSVLSNFETDLPIGSESRLGDINYLINIVEQHNRNRHFSNKMLEEVLFFTNQCDLMRTYIMAIEETSVLAETEKNNLTNEIKHLKEDYTKINMLLSEEKAFVAQIISYFPFKVLSLKQAAEELHKIFSEYNCLTEVQTNYMQELKAEQEKRINVLEECNSLKNDNSSLKIQLAKYEDVIRNTRSELRNLRSEQRKIRNRHMGKCCFGEENKMEAGIQTENLCCKQLNETVLKQKNMLNLQCQQINSLEIQIEKQSYPQKKKVSDLEEALAQAKEKIGMLNIKVKQLEAYNKDLVEMYGSPESHVLPYSFTVDEFRKNVAVRNRKN